ncbi:hypothetical protein [Aliiglaciecola lipolytica]|uniref:Uncharacterized protein n=1 Tax=Aliiglaciecola lipolytica E3 TaxID=1127673 RepID=K6YEX8_9ALTE|nr:hypothetical protein [Aliiglaciecola lipolytica]GAC15193.1 hypothetical protein GLIP_2568 [Aliiglaciecola lipolytica E3]
MNKLTLNHEYTPDKLSEINQQLKSVLSADSVDDAQLKSLIDQRDIIVSEHLQSLDADAEKRFAESELKVNELLTRELKNQLKDSLNQLSGLIRGQKKVDKYK